MAQITIYLDDELEKLVKAAARSANKSQSRWIAEILRQRLVTEWPAHIVELAGAWEDFPTPEQIRESIGKDVERKTI